MSEDESVRLAAIDQQLAELNDRQSRHGRSITHCEVSLLLIALVAVVYVLVARPAASYWHLAAAWAVVALGSAGSLVQGRILRNYRAEIRDLRSRVR